MHHGTEVIGALGVGQVPWSTHDKSLSRQRIRRLPVTRCLCYIPEGSAPTPYRRPTLAAGA